MSTRFVLALLTVLLLAAPSRAQLIDAIMRPFDLFTGEIEDPADIDLVSIDAVAGTSLVITVAPVHKSDLVPAVRLIDTSDDSVIGQITAPKKKAVLKVGPLPTTGSYLIRITGDAGTAGGYSLRYREKLAKESKKIQVDEVVTGGDTLEVTFEAANEFEVTLKVQRRNKKSLADPAEPTLHDPNDQELAIDEDQVKVNKSGDRFALKKVLLEATGTWTAGVFNEADDGELRVRLQIKRRRFKKRKLDEVPLGETGAATLAGSVEGVFAVSAPLEGATISVVAVDGDGVAGEDPLVTATDSEGRFIFEAPPAGEVILTLDGTTSDALYPINTVRLSVADEGPTHVAQPFSLQRRSAGIKTLIVGNINTVNGITTEVISGTNPLGSLSVAGPIGTQIAVDGDLFHGNFDMTLNPILANHVLVPLVDELGVALDAASYVTIEPVGASFQTGLTLGGTQGLDLTIPNTRQFPAGMLLDVWAYDETVGAWVNRSEQTLSQGQVSGDMATVAAPGVLLRGGHYAFAAPLDAPCATVLEGNVVDQLGNPLVHASVATSLGAFDTTDVNGDFSMSIPAYLLDMLPTCVGADIDVSVTLPVAFETPSQGTSLFAAEINLGGVTDLGQFTFSLPGTGVLVGRVIDNGIPVVGDTVMLTGPETIELVTDDRGRFSAFGMQPGSYQAAHTFTGAEAPTTVSFAVLAHEIVPIAVQRTGGLGSHDVTVTVLRDSGDPTRPFESVAGASVVLVGSDPFSSAGLQATANQKGQVEFTSVDPPYDVTAHFDVTFDDASEGRFATSLLGIDPPGEDIGLPVLVREPTIEPETDATLVGTVAHLVDDRDDFDYVYSVHATSTDPLRPFSDDVEVDEFDGTFEIPIPVGLDLHVVLRETTFDFTSFDDVVFVSGAAFRTQVEGAALVDDMVTVDFDIEGADFMPFATEVSLTYDGLPAPTTIENVTLAFVVTAPAAGVDDLMLIDQLFEVGGDDEFVPPGSLFLPDPDHASLAGLLPSLAVDITAIEEDFVARASGCRTAFGTGDTSANLDLLSQPLLSNPSNGEDFTLAGALGATFQFTDQTGGSDRGTTELILASDDTDLSAELGVDRVVWRLIVPVGEAGLTLPPTASPMLSPGIWAATVGVETWMGPTIEFDDLFDAQVEQRFIDLRAQAAALCDGLVENAFDIFER